MPLTTGISADDAKAKNLDGAADRVIDCDIHAEVPDITALLPHLPDYWIEQIRNTIFKGPPDRWYPPNTDLAVRPGSRVDGGPATLATVQEQLLSDRTETGILSCAYSVDSLHNPEQAVALARAVNDWQVTEWLEKEPRLRGSIVVPIQVPSLAVEEIERMAAYDKFVQILVPVHSHHPYGNRMFHSVWEAAERYGLVVGIQYGGAPGNPPTAVGWPSYYIEEYVGMAGAFASQLTSLICEGVFDMYPGLRVTLLESGVSWLATHMWRFDKEWKNLRRQVPWVKRPPSEYIRKHIRLTTQPFDGPREVQALSRLVEHLGSAELLLFSSDFPHQHATGPDEVFRGLSPERAEKVARGNAADWYQL